MAPEEFLGRPARSIGPRAIAAPYYGIKDTDFCPNAGMEDQGTTTDGTQL